MKIELLRGTGATAYDWCVFAILAIPILIFVIISIPLIVDMWRSLK